MSWRHDGFEKPLEHSLFVGVSLIQGKATALTDAIHWRP
jgi:hypothetical protein